MDRILYTSTRDAARIESIEKAVVDGLAPDGGLYVPTSFPRLPERVWNPAPLSYAELATLVLSGFFPDWEASWFSQALATALSSFRGDTPAPLVQAGDLYYLELFHGPTCAFKDFALSLMGAVLREAMNRAGLRERVAILVATSGDTGSAALSGFEYRDGISTVVYYPATGTSLIQRLQMTTATDPAQAVFGIRGSFDDAQRGVKRIFAESQRIFQETGVRLSSANSINIARLLPQIVYYIEAWRKLAARGGLGPDALVDFAVPTGNFGDILAARYAKAMGLPVGNLICASNRNKVLADFFQTGIYDRRRDFAVTSSPSMDILVSSNLERALFEASGRDPGRTSALMAGLTREGFYRLSDTERAWFADFSGGWAGEAETEAEIGRVYREYGYLLDPHTAVASVVASSRASSRGRPVVVCATASPFKFPAVCLKALGAQDVAGAGVGDLDLAVELARITGVGLPPPVAAIAADGKDLERHTEVLNPEGMEEALVGFLRGLR